MLGVYYAIGGWDHDIQEPVGGGVLIEYPVCALDAVEAMVCWGPAAYRRWGPGECVCLDDAGEWVDPYALAARERVAVAHDEPEAVPF